MAKILLDTNTLLDSPEILDNLIENEILIHSLVCEELDNIIHNSQNEDKKYRTRQARNAIKNHKVEYSTISPTLDMPFGWDKNKVDNLLLLICKESGYILYTSDLAMQIKAKSIGVEYLEYKKQNNEEYKGYKEVVLSEYEQSIHYECPINKWNLKINEYIILKDINGNIIDKQRWTEKGFVPVYKKPIKSVMFGDIKAKDVYQELAIDSLMNIEFTIFTGAAGSAKTLLALSYIMQSLQSGKIDKCVIVHNPVNMAGSQALGYYPGDRNQKILSTSLGGILASKFGDPMMVETLISQGKIFLVPTADIRGFEISEKSCLYVTEGQNLDIYTLKTILQRAKSGCKIIVEGDIETQIDARNCNGDKNGMKRAIDIFSGSNLFSYVELQNIYRSPIAEIAQRM